MTGRPTRQHQQLFHRVRSFSRTGAFAEGSPSSIHTYICVPPRDMQDSGRARDHTALSRVVNSSGFRSRVHCQFAGLLHLISDVCGYSVNRGELLRILIRDINFKHVLEFNEQLDAIK